MNAAILQSALGIPQARAIYWAPAVGAACDEFGITTPVILADFLAQIAHESAFLARTEELFNYSADGLTTTWPKHFDLVLADRYAFHPEMIANRAYADRMGNGCESSGDGWKNRGRGLMMMTGAEAYALAAKALGLDLVGNPNLLLDPVPAARAAAWEWHSKGLNELAAMNSAEGFLRETYLINGGYIGLENRQTIRKMTRTALGVSD